MHGCITPPDAQDMLPLTKRRWRCTARKRKVLNNTCGIVKKSYVDIGKEKSVAQHMLFVPSSLVVAIVVRN